MKASAYANGICKILPFFLFDWRIRWPKSSEFDPKSDDLGHQFFKPKNGMASKLKMLIIHDSKQQHNGR